MIPVKDIRVSKGYKMKTTNFKTLMENNNMTRKEAMNLALYNMNEDDYLRSCRDTYNFVREDVTGKKLYTIKIDNESIFKLVNRGDEQNTLLAMMMIKPLTEIGLRVVLATLYTLRSGNVAFFPSDYYTVDSEIVIELIEDNFRRYVESI